MLPVLGHLRLAQQIRPCCGSVMSDEQTIYDYRRKQVWVQDETSMRHLKGREIIE